jgi:predicted porin
LAYAKALQQGAMTKAVCAQRTGTRPLGRFAHVLFMAGTIADSLLGTTGSGLPRRFGQRFDSLAAHHRGSPRAGPLSSFNKQQETAMKFPQTETLGRLLTLALLGGSAGLAAAQSSVTVFGVLDVGVQSLKNGDKRLSLLSIDGMQTSRLGFRGTEDLGGGLSASFHLEGAIGPDVGSGGDWRRRATVSLSSKSAGEVRLGRDYTPTFWSISRFNAFGTNGVGGANNLIYGFDGLSSTSKTIVRSDNSVGYFLPGGLGGVYGQAMVAAGEGAPGKYIGARLGYASGAFDIAGAWSETSNNAAGDKFKVGNVGASYQLGAFKLLGLYHVSKQTTRRQTNWVVGGTYTVGAGTVRASYVRSDYSDAAKGSGADYNGDLIALGYVYNLSKRTALYGTASQVQNSAKGKFVIPGGSAVSPGQSSTGVEAGVYHSF